MKSKRGGIINLDHTEKSAVFELKLSAKYAGNVTKLPLN